MSVGAAGRRGPWSGYRTRRGRAGYARESFVEGFGRVPLEIRIRQVTWGFSVRQAAWVYSLIMPPGRVFGGSAVCGRRSEWRGRQPPRPRTWGRRCCWPLGHVRDWRSITRPDSDLHDQIAGGAGWSSKVLATRSTVTRPSSGSVGATRRVMPWEACSGSGVPPSAASQALKSSRRCDWSGAEHSPVRAPRRCGPSRGRRKVLSRGAFPELA
jgi:hypothetical protein